MAGTSIDWSSAEAYQDYVAKCSDKIYSKMCVGFKTAGMVTPHEGVKGIVNLQELLVDVNPVAWDCDFDCHSDVFGWRNNELRTRQIKVDLCFCPQETEGNYHGHLRQTGQSPTDLPYQAFMIDKYLNNLKYKQEVAVWQAVQSPTITPGVTPMLEMFDGYLEQLRKAMIVGLIFPTVYDPNDLEAAIENVYDSLDSKCKQEELMVMVSCKFFAQYKRQMRNKNRPGCCSDKEMGFDGISIDVGVNQVTLYAVAGMLDSMDILMGSKENFHYGYDAADDADIIYFQQDKRKLCGWTDFRMGTQIFPMDSGCIGYGISI